MSKIKKRAEEIVMVDRLQRICEDHNITLPAPQEPYLRCLLPHLDTLFKDGLPALKRQKLAGETEKRLSFFEEEIANSIRKLVTNCG